MRRRVSINGTDITVSAAPGDVAVSAFSSSGATFYSTAEAREYGQALVDAADAASQEIKGTTGSAVVG